MTADKKTALVAEDDAAIAKYYAKTLSTLGIEVTCVGDGAAAMEAIGQQQPHLLCLDLSLPIISGFEVLRRVRRTRRTRKTIVLVISARTGLDDQALVQELGASGFLEKPVRARELRDKVAELLRL